MKKYGKIVLAVALLLCLMPMPYGYYILIRYVSTIAFGVMAYRFFNNRQNSLCITFTSLALLFQPFIKIPLGREVWNFVDIIVAVFLIYLFFSEDYD